MNEMIYTYDGSFEGFLCCIFDSYANKEVLTAITDDEDSAPILFPVRRGRCRICPSSCRTARTWRRCVYCSAGTICETFRLIR